MTNDNESSPRVERDLLATAKRLRGLVQIALNAFERNDAIDWDELETALGDTLWLLDAPEVTSNERVPERDNEIPDEDDHVYTLERLAAWLDQKYKRHGEYPDKVAADAIRAFREATDAIMRVNDEAESFGIAHSAIVLYTRWKAVEPPSGFPGSDGKEVRSLAVGGAQLTQGGGDSTGMPLSVGRSRPDQTATIQNEEPVVPHPGGVGPWSRDDLIELREALTTCHVSAFLNGDRMNERAAHSARQFIYKTCVEAHQILNEILEPEHAPKMLTQGLDTPERVRFYEHDFYVLSNFSAFSIMWKDWRFDTSEAVYHWEKFPEAGGIRAQIRNAPSAHEAFKLAEKCRHLRRDDWDAVKVDIMRDILRVKAAQHEYVRRKLLATGERELVEDSWRDDFWGWGPNRDGKNMLGKLWMEIRAELRESSAPKVPRS